MENFELSIQNSFLNIFYKPTNSFIHSKHNPVLESDRFFSEYSLPKTSKILFFGFGAGFFLDSFQKKFGSSFDVLVIEPIKNLIEQEELKKKFLT